MDIEKLEKLGCLSLSLEQKEKMKKSIDSIMEMMHEIDKIKDVDSVDLPEVQCKLTDDVVNDKYLIDKESENTKLNMEDGMFLSPKTIRKE